MTTRTQLKPQLDLSAWDDKARLAINVGFKVYVVYFEDCVELDQLLLNAVRYDGLPATSAAAALEFARECFGHYEDDNFGDRQAHDAHEGTHRVTVDPPAFVDRPEGVGVMLGVLLGMVVWGLSWFAWRVW